MAEFVLYTSRDPRLLLEHAASGFLANRDEAEPFASPEYWLVLRQGGLRDDLLSLAARRGVRGWFDPPLALFQELPGVLCRLEREPVGDFERLVLVARALRESAGRAFGRARDLDAYADAVDRWIGELLGEGITPSALTEVQGRVGGGDDFERGRDRELLATYTRYLTLLEAADRRDRRARLIDCASAVHQDPATVAALLGGRRELRLVGLTDPRGGWPVLLGALKDCPALDRVGIYAAEPLDFVAALAERIVALDSGHFTSALFRGDAATAEPPLPVVLVSAPDLPREVDEIAVRVRRLVEQGTAPERVAVVSRSARPYGDQVLRALSRVGVPATARVRHALPEVPAVRALLALFHVAASGWERGGLVELAETPYFRARLDAGVLNHIGYQRRVRGLAQWLEAIAELASAARARDLALAQDPDAEDVRRAPLPATERVERALAEFEQFARLARALDEPRPIAIWLEWLDGFVAEDPWQLERSLYRVPGRRLSAVRTDLAGWRGLRRVIDEWRTAESAWGDSGEIDLRAFDARLRAMLAGDVALFTPVRRGVQVLEGLAAAFRSFDHVFIVGLDSARAPLRAPGSSLLDEHERRALREAGLHIDTRAQWEERERALFVNMLATAGASLTLSWSRYDETGAEQLPSAFVEEVRHAFGPELEELPGSRAFTPGMSLAADPTALAYGAHAAAVEASRASGELTPYSGRVENPAMLEWLATELGEQRVWSPTQIEAYAKCPWAYFSGRLLRLDKVVDPDLDLDPRVRGSILHDALRRFYTTARWRSRGPVYLRTADLEWAVPLVENSLEDAIVEAHDTPWFGHPALKAQRLAELTRQLIAYVRWEAEENESASTNNRVKISKYVRTGVEDHEIGFDDLPLEIDGVRLRIRGSIDRVETGIDERGGAEHLVAAVDYKTTRWSTPGGGEKKAWDDGVVLQVPLYALALTRIRPGVEAALVEYRAIKTRQRVHTLALYQYDKNGLSNDEKARAEYEGALRHVARHIRSARSGMFPVDPPSSCNCPPFCHARDICRIPGGPRSGR